MATPPLVCSSGAYNQFQGIVMDRCEIKMLDGTTTKSSFSLCDVVITLDDFLSFNTCLEPGISLLLNPEGIDMNGEVKLIIIKATYPSSMDPSLRYINFIHQGKTLPIGDLMILTGNPTAGSPGRGWDLSPNGTEISSPYFDQGGMVLYNPQTTKINIQVLLGSNPPGIK